MVSYHGTPCVGVTAPGRAGKASALRPSQTTFTSSSSSSQRPRWAPSPHSSSIARRALRPGVSFKVPLRCCFCLGGRREEAQQPHAEDHPETPGNADWLSGGSQRGTLGAAPASQEGGGREGKHGVSVQSSCSCAHCRCVVRPP